MLQMLTPRRDSLDYSKVYCDVEKDILRIT